MPHLFLQMYNVTQKNRCLTETVSTDGRQPLLTTEKRVGHTCITDQVTPALPHTLGYTECRYTVSNCQNKRRYPNPIWPSVFTFRVFKL